jgi:hypothetical protein
MAYNVIYEEFDRLYGSMEIASAGDASVASLDRNVCLYVLLYNLTTLLMALLY